MSGSPFFILETAGGGEATLANPTTFGRAEDNSVVLRDVSVSSHHAVIRKDGAFWIVEDLGSTNGTWLNHRKVDGKAVIKEGDQIQFGSQMIRVSGFRGTGDRRAQVPSAACPRCTKGLPHGAVFCPFCGLPLGSPPLEPQTPGMPALPLSSTAPFAVPHPPGIHRIGKPRLLIGCLLLGGLLAFLAVFTGWWAWTRLSKPAATSNLPATPR